MSSRPDDSPATSALRRWIIFWKLLGALAWIALAILFFLGPLLESFKPLQSLQDELRDKISHPSKRAFLLSVVSRPGGGRVTVSGTDRGNAPVLVNIECSEGMPVPVTVELPGYKTWRQDVPCQSGGNFDVEARMER